MRNRLAAAAAGLVLIAAAILAFSLSSRPVTAATNTVEPVVPSVFLDAGARSCQRVSRIPRGADRLKVVVTYVTGGARRLNVEIADHRGTISTGTVARVGIGETLIPLRPQTRAAHRTHACFVNPGEGRIVIGGDPKRLPSTPVGQDAHRKNVASLIFVRPGSASWVSQIGAVADRYANSQTGPLGAWSLWAAALLAICAAALALWSIVVLPERPS